VPLPADPLQPDEAPRRSRLRIALVIMAVLAVLVTGTVLSSAWVNQQYYVGAADEQVVIFNGVPGSLLGLPLQEVAEHLGFPLADLPETVRGQVREGIIASPGLESARVVANRLREKRLPQCAPTAPSQPGVAVPPPGEPTPLSAPQVVPGLTCRPSE
jgi:protein phosphatase